MRKTFVLLLPLLVGLSTSANAQFTEPKEGDVYGVAGLLLLGKDRGRDIGAVAAGGLGLGVQTTDRLSFEFHVARGETGVEGPAGPDVDVTALRLDGRYRLGGDAWHPELVGGFTRTRFSVAGADNDTGYGASLGLGLRRAITDRLSLQLDGRGFFDFDESKLQPGATLGFRYLLSESARPAPRTRPAEPAPVAQPEPVPPPAPEPAPVTPAALEVVVGFGFDSSALGDRQRRELDRVVAFLRRHPESTATLVGHTDNLGSDVYNQGLSERRAAAVRAYLLAAGIDAARMAAEGRGERDPVASNATEEGRQRNRRVVAIAIATVAE